MQRKTDSKLKVFSLFGRKNKNSVVTTATPSSGLGDGSLSSHGSDCSADRSGSLSPQPQVIQQPVIRSRKRAAPKPPPLQEHDQNGLESAPVPAASSRPPSELSETAASTGSRQSSDSSGYHETGLSDPPDSLPDQAPTSVASSNLTSTQSLSTSNLNSHFSTNLTKTNSTSTASLSSAIRKRRAPAPPPIPKIAEDPNPSREKSIIPSVQLSHQQKSPAESAPATAEVTNRNRPVSSTCNVKKAAPARPDSRISVEPLMIAEQQSTAQPASEIRRDVPNGAKCPNENAPSSASEIEPPAVPRSQAATSEPTQSAARKPAELTTPELSQPASPEPRQLLATEPEQPVTPEPKQPVAEGPGPPRTPELKQPVTSELPVTPERRKLATSELNQPVAVEAKQLMASEPRPRAAADRKQPATPEPKQSAAADRKQSLTPESKQPVTPEPRGQPLVAEREQPATPEPGQPAAAEREQPATPELRQKAAVAEQKQPATSEPRRPSAAERKQPATPEPRQPAAAEREQPAGPEQPAAAEHEMASPELGLPVEMLAKHSVSSEPKQVTHLEPRPTTPESDSAPVPKPRHSATRERRQPISSHSLQTRVSGPVPAIPDPMRFSPEQSQPSALDPNEFFVPDLATVRPEGDTQRLQREGSAGSPDLEDEDGSRLRQQVDSALASLDVTLDNASREPVQIQPTQAQTEAQQHEVLENEAVVATAAHSGVQTGGREVETETREALESRKQSTTPDTSDVKNDLEASGSGSQETVNVELVISKKDSLASEAVRRSSHPKPETGAPLVDTTIELSSVQVQEKNELPESVLNEETNRSVERGGYEQQEVVEDLVVQTKVRKNLQEEIKAKLASMVTEEASEQDEAWQFQLHDPPTPFQDLPSPQFQRAEEVTAAERSGSGTSVEVVEATNSSMVRRRPRPEGSNSPSRPTSQPAAVKPESRRAARQMSFSISTYSQRVGETSKHWAANGSGWRLHRSESLNSQTRPANGDQQPLQPDSAESSYPAETRQVAATRRRSSDTPAATVTTLRTLNEQWQAPPQPSSEKSIQPGAQQTFKQPLRPPRRYKLRLSSKSQSMQNLSSVMALPVNDTDDVSKTHSSQTELPLKSEANDLQAEFLKLQKQFLSWQQQLLLNQTVLQARVAPLAAGGAVRHQDVQADDDVLNDTGRQLEPPPAKSASAEWSQSLPRSQPKARTQETQPVVLHSQPKSVVQDKEPETLRNQPNAVMQSSQPNVSRIRSPSLPPDEKSESPSNRPKAKDSDEEVKRSQPKSVVQNVKSEVKSAVQEAQQEVARSRSNTPAQEAQSSAVTRVRMVPYSPPKVNLGSWSDQRRPTRVQLKEDTDYVLPRKTIVSQIEPRIVQPEQEKLQQGQDRTEPEQSRIGRTVSDQLQKQSQFQPRLATENRARVQEEEPKGWQKPETEPRYDENRRQQEQVQNRGGIQMNQPRNQTRVQLEQSRNQFRAQLDRRGDQSRTQPGRTSGEPEPHLGRTQQVQLQGQSRAQPGQRQERKEVLSEQRQDQSRVRPRQHGDVNGTQKQQPLETVNSRRKINVSVTSLGPPAAPLNGSARGKFSDELDGGQRMVDTGTTTRITPPGPVFPTSSQRPVKTHEPKSTDGFRSVVSLTSDATVSVSVAKPRPPSVTSSAPRATAPATVVAATRKDSATSTDLAGILASRSAPADATWRSRHHQQQPVVKGFRATTGTVSVPPPPPMPVPPQRVRQQRAPEKLPGLDPREELMIAIREHGGLNKLRRTRP